MRLVTDKDEVYLLQLPSTALEHDEKLDADILSVGVTYAAAIIRTVRTSSIIASRIRQLADGGSGTREAHMGAHPNLEANGLAILTRPNNSRLSSRIDHGQHHSPRRTRHPRAEPTGKLMFKRIVSSH